ncbi:MAG: hypothetical protein E6248_13230 [Clostridium sp.]|uniref:hypothetical protein n=1 Tax=Clostridium sp. TaxID=1506 RepID=UPI00290AADC0|nr:hypothetical protein [Clostridium sp.]MDU5111402.1 hypothetical protein [Clostridium sp.]
MTKKEIFLENYIDYILDTVYEYDLEYTEDELYNMSLSNLKDVLEECNSINGKEDEDDDGGLFPNGRDYDAEDEDGI